MPKKATDMEKVELALKTEQDGHEFYQMAAKKTSHKLARAAFELLGREELRHVALIEGLGRQLGGKGAAPTIKMVTRKALESDLKTIYGTAHEAVIEERDGPGRGLREGDRTREEDHRVSTPSTRRTATTTLRSVSSPSSSRRKRTT